ncbi:MAG: SPOR domain-containing protein [Gammaproteobacteria bacterium]|jgi:cell division protein FtsN
MATLGGFVTGALVGFGAALVLQQMGRLPNLDELAAPAQSSAGGNSSEVGKPTYEFYEMLANTEVLVPVLDALNGNAKEEAGERDAIYLLQAGSFRGAEDAERMRASLLLMGFNVETHPVTLDGTVWHRVMVGPFTNAADLRDAQVRLHAEDIDAIPLSRKGKG